MTVDPSAYLTSDAEHLIHSLHNAAAQQQALVWTRGEGALLYDQNDRPVLDALSGLWNVLVGHGRRELAAAAARQMETLAYASCYAGSSNPAAIELGERLAAITYPSINRFFFTSGGAEANESAFKTARYFWKTQGKPEKYKVIGRTWGYHGTTMAAMSATGIASYWPMFEPRVPGFSHIASPYPYRFEFQPKPGDNRTPGQAAADLLEEEILRQGPETVAAFIGEPVQGAGGVIVPQDDYWPRIREICDRYDVLLLADEVITGFGRTGDWFALSRYGIEPDIISFAKGVTSGYFPLGGIGVSDRIAQAIDAGPQQGLVWMHAFTYSAHPVACAVALANLDILQNENLLERARELGQALQTKLQTLQSHPHVGEVRGLGYMAAVEIVADKATKAEFPPEFQAGSRVHQATIRRGMFTRLRGDVYNFAPCYVASEQQLDQMVNILGESLDEVLK